MSKAAPARAPQPAAEGKFVIVASEFNSRYVDGLIEHALAELLDGNSGVEIELLRVPGAFEIPIVVQEIARSGAVAAILAIGVILQGETDHAQHLAHTVTEALQRIALEHRAPVIHCVLSLENSQQAEERCLGETINRGSEAGRAALAISRVLRDLRAKS